MIRSQEDSHAEGVSLTDFTPPEFFSYLQRAQLHQPAVQGLCLTSRRYSPCYKKTWRWSLLGSHLVLHVPLLGGSRCSTLVSDQLNTSLVELGWLYLHLDGQVSIRGSLDLLYTHKKPDNSVWKYQLEQMKTRGLLPALCFCQSSPGDTSWLLYTLE